MIWGCGSVGRASALHAEGRWFEPSHLHLSKVLILKKNKTIKKKKTKNSPQWVSPEVLELAHKIVKNQEDKENNIRLVP